MGSFVGLMFEGLTARGGDLEDDFLTTRGTPPESLMLFRGKLGADDLRASGWLWRDVAGPGLENVDEMLLRARAGIGSWNQLTPRVVSAGCSSIIGCQKSSCTHIGLEVADRPDNCHAARRSVGTSLPQPLSQISEGRRSNDKKHGFGLPRVHSSGMLT